MSVERKRAAGWLGGAAAAGAAGIVAAFCCAPAAAVAGAGVAATGGILRNPWLISAGILIVAVLAIAALVLRRTGGAENCCPPTVTAPGLQPRRRPRRCWGRTGSRQMPVQPSQERTERSVRVPSPRDDPVPACLQPGPDPSRQRRTQLIPALHRPPIEEQRAVQTHRHLGMLPQPHHLLFRKRRAATPTLQGLLHPLIVVRGWVHGRAA